MNRKDLTDATETAKASTQQAMMALRKAGFYGIATELEKAYELAKDADKWLRNELTRDDLAA